MTYRMLIVFGILSLFVSACGGLSEEPEIVRTIAPAPTSDPTAEHLAASDPEALGEHLFQEHCTACHGNYGQGDGPIVFEAGLDIPDFTDPATTADQSFEQWTNTIRFGRLDSMMPPWENAFTEEEIQAVAQYTYTLHERAAEIAEVTPESTEAVAEAPEEAVGLVYGSLTNGTASGTLPEQLSIGLHVLDSDMQEIAFETQLVPRDNPNFQFDEVTVRADLTYMVTAIYNDTVFYSDVMFGTPANPALHLPVTVYDVTNDPSAVTIDLFLTRVIQDGDEMIFQQLINFKNTSDRMYRADNQLDSFTYESVLITLPEGAKLLNTIELIPRFLMAEDQRTIVDTQPVLPNSEHTVEIVYALPYSLEQGRVSVEFPIHYNMTNQVELLVQPGFQASSDQLESLGMQQFSTGLYESYLGSEMSADTTLQYNIAPGSSFHSQQAAERQSQQVAMAAGGVGFLLLSAVIYWRGMRGKNDPPAQD